MKNPSLHIAITGANGFVARNLRRILYEKKISAVCIARRNFRSYTLESKIVSSDLSEKNLIPKLKDCETLIHLIGIGRETAKNNFNSTNIELTKKIIKICKKARIKKIIYASALGVSKNSTSGYFISKFMAEQAIIDSHLDYTIFRPSYIIGKDDLLTTNLNNQIKNGLVIIPGSGKYKLQPIFVNDVIEIILKAITEKNFSNKIIDLVGPELVSFEKYVKIFKGKRKARIRKINLEKAYHDAINNLNNVFGIDDLNILIGNFIGDFKTLAKISNLDFTSFREALKTSSLS